MMSKHVVEQPTVKASKMMSIIDQTFFGHSLNIIGDNLYLFVFS